MKNTKGQAAMEFLMTYGWAILVVLAAVAALAYFGVLSPDKFIPEKCTFPSGIACIDSTATAAAGLRLVVQNSAGFDMTGVVITATGSCAGSSAATNLANGDKSTVTVTCAPAMTAGTKAKVTLSMAYVNNESTLSHTAAGELIKRVG